MLTKTKVKTGTKVGLILVGAAAIAAAVIVNYGRITTKVTGLVPTSTSTRR